MSEFDPNATPECDRIRSQEIIQKYPEEWEIVAGSLERRFRLADYQLQLEFVELRKCKRRIND